jgi:hypothetical protein
MHLAEDHWLEYLTAGMKVALLSLLFFALFAEQSYAIEDNFQSPEPLDYQSDRAKYPPAPLQLALDLESHEPPRTSSGCGEAYEDCPQKISRAEPEQRSSFLPLMADKVGKRGYELPLPYGISANFFILERELEVESVRVGIDRPPQSIDRFFSVAPKSSVSNISLRFDAWLLPFLNLYGLAGFTQSESEIQITIKQPGPGLIFNTETDLDGPTVGVGMTLAAGYKSYFLTLDTNYSFTDMDTDGVFDGEFKAMVASVRTGWHGKVGKAMMRIWLGGTYWDIERNITGSIKLPDDRTLFFEVDQGPVDPGNLNIGTNLEISRQFSFTLDYGFNFDDMNSLMGNVTYRF